MKFSNLILLTSVSLVSGIAGNAPITQPTLGVDPYTGLSLPEDAYGASVLAYIYGSPLLTIAGRCVNGGLARAGVNKFLASTGLHNGSTPTQGSNVDTVYGEAFLDLAAQDLEITVPPMQNDRYYSFSFFDFYSDDFYILGSLYNNTGGKYHLRPALKTGKGGLTKTNCQGYAGCIDSPVLNLLLLVRVLVKNPNNQSDVSYVKKYLKNINLKAVNKHTPTAPILQQSDFDNLDSNNVTQAFQLTARLADRNPPQNTLLATFNPFTLLAAGISNGTYTPIPSVDLGAVNQAQIDITNAFAASPLNLISLPPNGWIVPSSQWAGSFANGTNLVARSYFGLGRFGNPSNQAIYVQTPEPLYNLSAKGEAYILQFSGKPPTNTRVGFWSLTMYDANDYFVQNPQNVQALGDRSQLTYPDGEPVYNGGNPARDDPFQILIQPYDQTPPANWTNNWLPSPTGGDSFMMLMRIYAPEPEAYNGQYSYPTFQKINALTAH